MTQSSFSFSSLTQGASGRERGPRAHGAVKQRGVSSAQRVRCSAKSRTPVHVGAAEGDRVHVAGPTYELDGHIFALRPDVVQ